MIEPTWPQLGIVHQTLVVLPSYMIFSDNGECIHICINQINLDVENELSDKLKQTDLRLFFTLFYIGKMVSMSNVNILALIKKFF